MRYLVLAPLLGLLPIQSMGQKLHKDIEQKLLNHINILASDSMEGRRAGSIGEQRASEYIAKYFNSIGLSPLQQIGTYTQPFDIADGDKITQNSYISFNSNRLDLNQIIFLPFSSRSGNVKGTSFVKLREKDGLWLIDIKEQFPNLHPHSDIINELRNYTQQAVLRGSKTVAFYNAPDFIASSLIQQPFSQDLGIPAFYIVLMEKGLLSTEEPIDLDISYSFSKSYRKSNNVIGYLNNKKDTTIIVGAHYDHLGYGEDGNSMLRNAPPQIHNGADDNASGTAALLEVANHIVKNRKKYDRYNFIFSAFSGEELGLLGSKHMADNLSQFSRHVKFMINLDMVGRLNVSSKSITIGGYGTSPHWSTIFSLLPTKELSIKFDSTGSGPSDHTSFYRKNIPVLFYFTGLHQDYHKPSDDSDKININGIKIIIKNLVEVIKASSQFPINFTKTREVQTSTNTRFSVSLGIMPDYSFNEGGVRIDGTSDGKLAQLIGLKAGDIIIRLGDIEVSSVETYMKALSKFKKGDKTEIEVKRNAEKIIKSVTFQ